jgi:NAD-dependent DNA ligase
MNKIENDKPVKVKRKYTRKKMAERTPKTESLNEKLAGLMSKLSEIMTRTGEPMKARAYKKAEETILSTQTEIKSASDLKGKPGIGEAILKKINEYLETGTIALIEREENKPEVILTNVYGIGPQKAKELVKKGITTIDQLKQQQNDVLNDVQRKGLKYYDDILKRIPRKEIDQYNKMFQKTFKKIADKESKYEIVGSYRRGVTSSGDIDVIITSASATVFEQFIDSLISQNIIVEVLSRGKNKCLVVSKIPSSDTYRRTDFLYSTVKEYPFSILYFTGSKGFNAVMRGHALKQGYSLNEHGLSVMGEKGVKGSLVDHTFTDEKSIFDFLKLQYKTPVERVDGRSVILIGSQNRVGSPIQKRVSKKKEPITDADDPDRTISENILLTPVLKKPIVKTKAAEAEAEADPDRTISENILLTPIDVISQVELKLKEQQKKKKREPKNKTSKKETPKQVTPKQVTPKQETPKQVTPKQVTPKQEIQPTTNTNESQDILKTIQEFKTVGITVLEKLDESTLSKILQLSNDVYYNENRSLLTDNEYDIIKEFVAIKFPKTQVLEEIGAPIQGKNKVDLPFEMASMDKIKPDSGALKTWTEKYSGPYVLSCKLDGVSGMYVCDTANKYKLYTRGNGLVGQDVSHLISVLKLPKLQKGMAVRGEFIIPKSVFKTKYAEEFANARNLVSGIINRKSTDEKAKDLHFITYEVVQPDLKPSEQIATLKKFGLEVVYNTIKDTLTNEMLSDTLVDWRTNYEYEIDGVIVSNDAIYPRSHGNPNHSFAFKMVMSDQVAEAKVVDVLWEASKDGYLKPRVRIEPIQLAGVRIEYATGFNGKFIQDNKIGIGAVIVMVRSGDVIPYIKSVTTPADNPKMPLVPYVWNKTHVDVLLENPNDDVTVQEKNVTMFFVSLDVDGLGKGNIKKLFQTGKTTVPAILKMMVSDFEKVDGFKTKMAEKLYGSIQDKIKNASLLDIIVASGKMGRGLGERKIKPILAKYPDIMTSNESDETKETMLKEVDGIGKENAHEFVKNISEFMIFLKDCDLEDKLNRPVLQVQNTFINTGHPLFQKKIVMTKVRDKEIIDFMNKHGLVLEDSMKKDTFVLIVKSKEDKSNKTAFAEKNGIPVMTVEEFKAKYM